MTTKSWAELALSCFRVGVMTGLCYWLLLSSDIKGGIAIIFAMLFDSLSSIDNHLKKIAEKNP